MKQKYCPKWSIYNHFSMTIFLLSYCYIFRYGLDLPGKVNICIFSGKKKSLVPLNNCTQVALVGMVKKMLILNNCMSTNHYFEYFHF